MLAVLVSVWLELVLVDLLCISVCLGVWTCLLDVFVWVLAL